MANGVSLADARANIGFYSSTEFRSYECTRRAVKQRFSSTILQRSRPSVLLAHGDRQLR